ncbi:MAG: hypothetical protein HPY55_16225 [Firmicutes bacterium]|nr:hypothetical protein [Bacillota bacterium]
MPNSLFTWEALVALAGASLLVFLVTQYTKVPLDRLLARWGWHLPTDLYAVIIATAVLITAQLAIGANPRDWRVYALAVANAFLVAANAGQYANKVLNPPGATKEGPGASD